MSEFLLKIIYTGFHRIRALFFGIILIVLICAPLDGFFEKIIPIASCRFCLYGFFIFIWIVYWIIYRFYLPKNSKNKVGIVIAIHAESNHEEIRLKEDFIKNLKKNIKKEKFANVINLVRISNHHAARLENKEDIFKLHKKIKGHFYLYGSIKRRMDGQQTYFLNLDGMVVHRPIPNKVSNAFSSDFRIILPQQISFLESLEFGGFQFTSDIVYLAVRYVTGIAAFFSGDVFLAHNLHDNLKQEFKKFNPLPDHFRYIRDKSALLLSDEEVFIAKAKYLKKDYESAREWGGKALVSNPNNYGGLLLKAVLDFILDKNATEALKSIKRAEKNAKGTCEWRYSKAFLYFWVEKYDKALKICHQIFQQNYAREEKTVLEVEAFVLERLEEQEDKIQLYYWLGFINYRKLNNLPKALEYFEKFEQGADSRHSLLKKTSSVYLREIKKNMKLKK